MDLLAWNICFYILDMVVFWEPVAQSLILGEYLPGMDYGLDKMPELREEQRKPYPSVYAL